MPPITVMMKPASGMCNMQCDYCFYCDETSKREQASYGFMSEKTLKNIIRKTLLRAEGSITYMFQGGEPTLRGIEFFETFLAYTRQYNKKGIPVYMGLQTNGFAIDEAWCRFFKENHFLIGVSVDGTQAIHDSCRHDKSNGPTFWRIKQSTDMMDRIGVDYNILTVVTKSVANAINEIYTFYKTQNWHYQQYIACLDPLDEPHGQNPYSITPEEYGQFLINLFELWYADWQKGCQPYIRQFENYLGIILGYFPEACDQNGTCGIQNVVEADGSVYPCDFYMLDAYRLGNYNENNMDDINAKRKEIGFIEQSFQIADTCKACRHYRICRGGCQRNRDYHEEQAAYTNYFCNGYQMFFDQCYGRMEEMAQVISQQIHKS